MGGGLVVWVRGVVELQVACSSNERRGRILPLHCV